MFGAALVSDRSASVCEDSRAGAALAASSTGSPWGSLTFGVFIPVVGTAGGASGATVGVGTADGSRCWVEIIMAWVCARVSPPARGGFVTQEPTAKLT